MSWLCINCETVNFDAETRCIVCGDERYYTASEMKMLLENHPEIKQLREENKKLHTQNKWLQTRNKNLTQENKQLKSLTEQLQKPIAQEESEPFSPTLGNSIPSDIKQKAIISQRWTQKIVFWQITTALATLAAILIAVL
jgi:DNA repair exonuclease SbcCD ATPase subunit